jgi:hypothetical protein
MKIKMKKITRKIARLLQIKRRKKTSISSKNLNKILARKKIRGKINFGNLDI